MTSSLIQPAPAADSAFEKALRWFFVRGHARSGTNWVCALLNLHPRILCVGEMHFEILRKAVDHYLTPRVSVAASEPLASMTRDWLAQLVERTLQTLAQRKPAAQWVGDRTPTLLQPLLPGCRHIVVVRDGRDVLVSWTLHMLARGGVKEKVSGPAMRRVEAMFREDPKCFEREPQLLLSDERWVRHCARLWSSFIEEHLDTVAAMERGDVDGQALLLSYEQLHDDVERERRRLYRFLDVDPDEAAPVSETTRTVPGYSADDPRSFHRKGVVGDWKRHATDDFRRWFKEEAGQALVRLGYEQDHDW